MPIAKPNRCINYTGTPNLLGEADPKPRDSPRPTTLILRVVYNYPSKKSKLPEGLIVLLLYIYMKTSSE
jgi:hypothetical protein